jgi:hypothetical protein
MSDATRWLKACGIGCGLMLLLAALVGTGSYYLITRTVEEAQQIETVTAEVRERHGGVRDFRPDPSGVIPARRMEAFLEVRERMAPIREETQGALALLSETEREKLPRSPAGLLGRLWDWGLGLMTMEAGTRLIPQILRYVESRAEAMLEAGIGPGEYLYIYVIAYYSWLQNSAADGPDFRLVGDDEGTVQPSAEALDAREPSREQVLRDLNRVLLSMLRSQLAALDAGAVADGQQAWRRSLAAEIAAMEENSSRIPWRDGLPEPIESSLRPFRQRLGASYSALCNPLEVMALDAD